MKQRMIVNDIKGNPLLAFTAFFFMAVSAFMFGMTCFLAVNLLGSVGALMDAAGTPDFLQMHTGEISEEKLRLFAEEKESVRDYQTLKFLNLDNSQIYLNRRILTDSTQDNGVCVQSGKFDYLLDMENQIIRAEEGQIYVPVVYRQEYDLRIGETVQIGQESFRIAGFLRDSQMNSMMASSKRFLVNEDDYEKLLPIGSQEYLIEFRVADGVNLGTFSAQYMQAGLPANGPSITKPLIRMMNALSDGVMIAMILLAGVVLLLISLLCIRFTLLAELEGDLPQIGMMKAIGLSNKEIKSLYFLKFPVLSFWGSFVGIVMVWAFQGMFSGQIRELYGPSVNENMAYVIAAAGIVLTETIILLIIGKMLKRVEKQTAVEVLRGETGQKKSMKFGIITAVIAAGSFMMILPVNILTTVSSPKFVTYMGIGNSELLIDLRQNEDLPTETKQAEMFLRQDKAVEKYSAIYTTTEKMILPDGSTQPVYLGQGDHSAFPVTYAKGQAPGRNTDIALSCLLAKETGLRIGDKISLLIDNQATELTVCGIYSDITNGGKTAKALPLTKNSPVTWSNLYVTLREGTPVEDWIRTYSDSCDNRGINARVVDISDYVDGTYGTAVSQIRMASRLIQILAAAVLLVVVFLFTRLLLALERNDISLVKAIGFDSGRIRRAYLIRFLPSLIIGMISGMAAGIFLGEIMVGAVLRSMGAAGFRFILNGCFVFGVLPAITIGSVLAAIFFGLRKVQKMKAYECCMGRE